MSYQSSETPTRASIDAHREWCRFVFENSDLNDMDEETLSRVWWRDDAADLANTRAFSYGGIKEATAIFFWSKQRGVYRLDEPVLQSRQDSCNLDDIFALNGDTSYLLDYGRFDDRVKFRGLALGYATSAISGFEYSTSNMRTLGELVTRAIDLGYDLHNSTDGISPLIRVIHDKDRAQSAERMKARLHAWLTLLKSTGVDLQIYGQEEWNRFQALQRDCERPWDWWHGVGAHQCPGRGYFFDSDLDLILIAFAYGREVSDWKLWLLHPGDEYAGQFWRLIEQNGIYYRHVPGGWVEDGWL
jgi:hypothetical protein